MAAPTTTRTRRIIGLLPLWTVREVRVQYRQSALDMGWSLITPVVTLAGYGLVLTRAFGVDGDGVPYLTFAWAGMVVWTFVANALTRGALSLVTSADLVRKAAFPREVVPIAAVFASGLDLLIGLTALGALMAVQGVRPTYHLVAAVPVIVAMTVWVAGLAILLAVITSFIRDLAHGLNVLLRIGIFVTPIMYPVTQVPARYHWTLEVNSISVFAEAVRDCLLRGRWPQWWLLGAHTLGGGLVLLAALAYARRVEGRIADVI